MKRILIFSLTYHPYIGGAEVAIKEITDRLNPDEYAFDMVTLRFDRALPKIEKVGNITVYRLGPSVAGPRVSDRDMPWQLRLAKLLFPFTALVKGFLLDQKNVYDMTWCMMANQAGFAALFFKYLHPRTPYVLELQDGRAFLQMKKRRRILAPLWGLYRRIYLKADVIKVISSFIEKEVRGIGYVGRVEIIPNAVDVARFSAPVSPPVITELKARFGKKDDDTFLFTASRLVLSRGVEDCIHALSFLSSNVKLLIAGSGEDQSKLERIAHEIGVAERVIFAGHIDHSELPALYNISDIFVRPSVIEGFGNAFVEAFAAGIPVVATPVGGIPDFLFDPERNPDKPPTGLFCEVQNPESIATSVTKYMNDPALVTKVVSNAKKLVSDKYDWAIIARDMQNKIFETLKKGG